MSEQVMSQDDLKRSVLFVPCETKAHLHRWIKVFLELDIPDCVVDAGSNCTPMDMIYEVYSKCLKNDDEDFDRVLYYAARGAFKTLSAAILEVLGVVHLDRNVGHMAAIEGQSQNSQQYVKACLAMPMLREFVVGNNQEQVWVVRYTHKETGISIPEKAFQQLTEADKSLYVEKRFFIKIVVCTMAGANSLHVPLFCIDEVDVVINKKAYEQAQQIPTPYGDKMPITLLTSTRKFNYGLVQKEIDKAAKSGLKIRHWNILDVTQACKPERHLPLEPKIPIYVSADALDAIEKPAFDKKTADEQSKYVELEGYAGCLKNCSIFAACKGRLATEQKSTSALLKPLSTTINNFRKTDLDMAKAELLCEKPTTAGLVYPRFNREIHMITAAQMAEKITGEPFSQFLTKEGLIEIMRQWDLKWYSGMDFGYSHNFAVVTGAVDGMRTFVVDVIAEPGLEPSQMIDVCNKRIRYLKPAIFADKENPMLINILKKAGFKMRDWVKGPGSVQGGIDTVRLKLQPTMGQPQLFLLKGDPQCELLATRLGQYHYMTDAAGEISDVPDDEDDDECDALRYFVMNVFGYKARFVTAGAQPQDSKDVQANTSAQQTKDAWEEIMRKHGVDQDTTSPNAKGGSGTFKFDLS